MTEDVRAWLIAAMPREWSTALVRDRMADALTPLVADALALARAEEAARWRAQIEALRAVSHPGPAGPLEPSGSCARCGRPTLGGPDGDLRHLTPDGRLSVKGCQSASFDWPGGRDRSIPKWWKAVD